MLWMLAWMPLDYGVVSPVNGKALYTAEVEGGAYKTIRHGAETVSFKVKAEVPFTVEVKYWYDGEYWVRKSVYDPGEYTLTFSLRGKDGAEMIPTRGLGPRPGVITVKAAGRVLLSGVEVK